MSFPDKKYTSIGNFASAYFERYKLAAQSIDKSKLAEASRLINLTYVNQSYVYVCGNGGSAAIANHFQCDHLKGCQTDTPLLPHVISLSSNIETITALANDRAFSEVFVYQLRSMAKPNDILVTVSSSGDSENIVNACKWAKNNNIKVISMTGFNKGRSGEIADINLHVTSDNYGIIEDVHQSIMHILAQFIRLENMEHQLIDTQTF